MPLRVKASVFATYTRIAALLTEKTGDEHSEGQAGRAALERYGDEFERELLAEVNRKATKLKTAVTHAKPVQVNRSKQTAPAVEPRFKAGKEKK